MIIFESFWQVLYQVWNSEAAGVVAKIGSCLKSNHQKQIYLAQIGETHCRNTSRRQATKYFPEYLKWTFEFKKKSKCKKIAILCRLKSFEYLHRQKNNTWIINLVFLHCFVVSFFELHSYYFPQSYATRCSTIFAVKETQKNSEHLWRHQYFL